MCEDRIFLFCFLLKGLKTRTYLLFPLEIISFQLATKARIRFSLKSPGKRRGTFSHERPWSIE